MATNKRLIKSNEGGAAVPTSFNTIIWDGDVSTSRDITDVGFQPDFVWIKPRTNTNWHQAFDSVRGVAKTLFPNETFAPESVSNSAGYLSSFNNDGFTVLAGSVSDINVNQINEKYVAWCWKAGGAAVTNTDGTITSQVSANTEAGFSIVSWTGNGVANSTIGHGLGATPKIMIVKNRTTVQSWLVQTTVIDGSNDYLFLNLTNAASNSDEDVPTDTIYNLSPSFFGNALANNFVGYFFAEVEGFSNFGSYVGTGTTSGPTVITGFEPAFIVCKRSNSTGNWVMLDNKRVIENPKNKALFANLSNAEDTGYSTDFLENGFQIKDSGSDLNTSGGKYIYMAFANQF